MDKEIPYRHGGKPRLDFLRLNLRERPVFDFSVNLNPLGPPKIIKEKWLELSEGIENYPTLHGEGVVSYYEKQFGISPKNILAGNGSTEMIYLIPRALQIKKIVILMPSYHDYSRASNVAGAEVIPCGLSPENSFRLKEIDKVVKALENADALWMGNPNNPTGTLFPREVILDLAKKFPDKWFIVDEAFMPFVKEKEREETSLMGIQKWANIMVTHSLTKFFCLAGLRLGGIIGDEHVIGRLRKIKEPWTVNGLAERIAPLLLECEDYEAKTRILIEGERKRISSIFRGMRGIHFYPSWANFMLCQWQGSEDLDALMRHLLSNGVYIRDCRNFPGLEKNYFRFAIRSEEENDRLITLLASCPHSIDG
ncbi:MAG: threonine-phosphate decarboxylase CobD [Pseudomonadota bacterium]